MLDKNDVVIAAGVFAEAVQAVAADLAVGDVGQEEDFSGQLIGRIKGRIDGLATPNTSWKVAGTITDAEDGDVEQAAETLSSVRFSGRQLTSKGVKSEEWHVGADLLLVFDIRTPSYHACKGALIQAKRLEVGQRLGLSDATRLRGQCSDMIDITSESFVFLYASQGVVAISAAAVEASSGRDLHALEPYPGSIEIFFMDFLLCWVGDPRLSSTTRASLAVLRALVGARNALLVHARAKSE